MQVFKADTADVSGTAERLELNRATGELLAVNARLKVTADGAELAAQQIAGNANQRRFELTGGVQLRTRDGVTGKTSAAHFDGAQGARGIAWGEAPTEVSDPAHQAQLTAAGFRLDLSEERATFVQPKTRLGPPQ